MHQHKRRNGYTKFDVTAVLVAGFMVLMFLALSSGRSSTASARRAVKIPGEQVALRARDEQQMSDCDRLGFDNQQHA